MTEDELVGWHNLLDGHEFEQAPGVGGGQGLLLCDAMQGVNESRICLSDWSALDDSGVVQTWSWYSSLFILVRAFLGLLVAQLGKNLPAVWETWVRSLGWEDALEESMATHSSILAWRMPWLEEPGGLQSVGSQRVRHGWATSTFTLLMRLTAHWKPNPLPSWAQLVLTSSCFLVFAASSYT